MSITGNRMSSQLRHALRTPLNQISGYTEMLIEDLDCDAPEAIRESLNAVRESGRTILKPAPGRIALRRTDAGCQ